VLITGAGASGTVVVNNRIGITAASTGAALGTVDLTLKLGNVQDGVAVTGSASNITIGGAGTNAPNIIGGNRFGIAITNTSNVTVKGNQLRVSKNVLSDNKYPALRNLQDGVFAQLSATPPIGGTHSPEGNQFAD